MQYEIHKISEEQLKFHEFLAVSGALECLLSFDKTDTDEPYSVCESSTNMPPRLEFFASLDQAKAFIWESGWGHDVFDAL